MAVIIKNDERRQHEAEVLHSFGVSGRGTAAQREAAEIIAARSNEVANSQERRKYYGFN